MKKRKLRIGRILALICILILIVACIIFFVNKKDSPKKEEKQIDTKAPDLKLNGEAEITLYVGDIYQELEATASDNIDGDITDKIVISGEVDTNKVGEYVITYKAIDSSNNATSIERKIKVIERPKPVDTNNGVVGTTSKGYKIEKRDGVYYINNILIANKTYSLPSGYNPGDLLDVFKENFNKM